jgi:predicted alpha/beta hydrolase family esterase
MVDTTLIVPGLYGSSVEHWQSWFERKIPNCVRVVQSDWDEPSLPQWSAKLRRELNRVPGRIWIVAHSFGCLAAVQTAFDYRERISGLMLVAPADPSRFDLQGVITEQALGMPSVVVASTNDPWMAFERAAAWADVWGTELINLGEAGHINVRAGFGPWPRGLEIYRALRAEAEQTLAHASHAREEPHLELGEL